MNLTFTKGYKLRKQKYPDMKELNSYIDDISETVVLRRNAVRDGYLEEADRYTTMIECMQRYVVFIHGSTLDGEDK